MAKRSFCTRVKFPGAILQTKLLSPPHLSSRFPPVHAKPLADVAILRLFMYFLNGELSPIPTLRSPPAPSYRRRRRRRCSQPPAWGGTPRRAAPTGPPLPHPSIPRPPAPRGRGNSQGTLPPAALVPRRPGPPRRWRRAGAETPRGAAGGARGMSFIHGHAALGWGRGRCRRRVLTNERRRSGASRGGGPMGERRA